MLDLVLVAALALAGYPAASPTTSPVAKIAAAAVPHYRLRLRIDPETHALAVRGSLDGRICDAVHHLYLNRSFHVTSFRAAGKGAPVRFDTAAPPAQWTDVTRPLVFDCRPGPLDFAYEGAIADTISGVNAIASGLVELAMYSGWFPYDPDMGAFTYEVEVSLPRGWTVVAGGRIDRSGAPRDREVFRFGSVVPGTDIAFMAAPGLAVQRAGTGAAAVEIYAPADDPALATEAMADLRRALALYASWFGLPEASGSATPTRLVFSPRGGWGYSRLPVIMVSARLARDWSRQPSRRGYLVLGTAHELAHFWWHIADTGTTDDWLNEGLAEFSAYSAAREIFGPEVGDSVAASYRRHAASVTSPVPIATTGSETRERYTNRYEKPALLFASVQSTVGPERFRDFLKAFYAGHAGRLDATTPAFLDAARAHLGEDAAARIAACVTNTWTAACAGTP